MKSLRLVGSIALALTFAAAEVSQAQEAAAPVKVLMIGDSMMKLPGRAMKKKLTSAGTTAEVVASIGSGLSRLDQYDWITKTEALMGQYKPETVVILLGANDTQPMQAASGIVAPGTEAWSTEYTKRVGQLMDVIQKGGAKKTIWIGLPCMRDKERDAESQTVNGILKAAAAQHQGVEIVDTYALFSKNGAYSSYIILPDGTPLDAREGDGIHFNIKGADYLADQVVKRVQGK